MSSLRGSPGCSRAGFIPSRIETMKLPELLGIELPIIQAPMAGVQGHALAAAVSNAGGTGSLRCAMLGPDDMRGERATIQAQTGRPFHLNLFCQPPTTQDWKRARGRAAPTPPFHET